MSREQQPVSTFWLGVEDRARRREWRCGGAGRIRVRLQKRLMAVVVVVVVVVVEVREARETVG